ncbi:hypothetical protein OCA8868_00103 [Octadecabacter ascidiaceicola]|uniref:Thioredoxin-like fold domain-containing protein n=1 Tax=Octadecabacter ascidiaceicola TaxID=1655543 RepID=A0A238JJU0_9RHOB|nr:hypothetical protein OCA8868_00103 [Octadecabacter ascidiaceicola]
MFNHLTRVFAATAFFALPSLAPAETTLLMAEEPGCVYCAQWNAQIGPIYEKTGEGAAAPLRRMDITEPQPDDITLARAINFTPTFVLLVDGEEVSRLEGYPGEDFFWGLVGMILEQNDIPFDVKTESSGDGT